MYFRLNALPASSPDFQAAETGKWQLKFYALQLRMNSIVTFASMRAPITSILHWITKLSHPFDTNQINILLGKASSRKCKAVKLVVTARIFQNSQHKSLYHTLCNAVPPATHIQD